MSDVPTGLKYTTEHEWVKVEGDRVRIGITHFAQEQLGDLVFVELPPVGRKLTATKACGVVESVKAASDIYSPISGTVVEANDALIDQPDLANSDPYDAGWMLVLAPSDTTELDGLLDADAYGRLLAEAEA